MPVRIQLRRTKGWRKPEGAIVVARLSRWGNPFTFKDAESAGFTRKDAVTAFADWLHGNPWACGADRYEAKRQAILDSLSDLRGHDLCCWCPLGSPCHADILLELANA